MLLLQALFSALLYRADAVATPIRPRSPQNPEEMVATLVWIYPSRWQYATAAATGTADITATVAATGIAVTGDRLADGLACGASAEEGASVGTSGARPPTVPGRLPEDDAEAAQHGGRGAAEAAAAAANTSNLRPLYGAVGAPRQLQTSSTRTSTRRRAAARAQSSRSESTRLILTRITPLAFLPQRPVAEAAPLVQQPAATLLDTVRGWQAANQPGAPLATQANLLAFTQLVQSQGSSFGQHALAPQFGAYGQGYSGADAAFAQSPQYSQQSGTATI